jgi:hypothetical protein
VVDGWADLELEIPGPNGEAFLQDALCFFKMLYVRIDQAVGGMDLLYVRIEDHHYFHGHRVFTIPMKEFWFLFYGCT